MEYLSPMTPISSDVKFLQVKLHNIYAKSIEEYMSVYTYKNNIQTIVYSKSILLKPFETKIITIPLYDNSVVRNNLYDSFQAKYRSRERVIIGTYEMLASFKNL